MSIADDILNSHSERGSAPPEVLAVAFEAAAPQIQKYIDLLVSRMETGVQLEEAQKSANGDDKALSRAHYDIQVSMSLSGLSGDELLAALDTAVQSAGRRAKKLYADDLMLVAATAGVDMSDLLGLDSDRSVFNPREQPLLTAINAVIPETQILITELVDAKIAAHEAQQKLPNIEGDFPTLGSPEWESFIASRNANFDIRDIGAIGFLDIGSAVKRQGISGKELDSITRTIVKYADLRSDKIVEDRLAGRTDTDEVDVRRKYDITKRTHQAYLDGTTSTQPNIGPSREEN